MKTPKKTLSKKEQKNNLEKINKKNEDIENKNFSEEEKICLNCGECCKKYSITILPKNAKTISKKLCISEKDFLQNFCELYVQIYPKANSSHDFDSSNGILVFPTSSFPKPLIKELKGFFSYLPGFFLVLPQIILKKNDGVCCFLDENNFCKIYSARLSPCKLFPFISVVGYEEYYSFCALSKAIKKDFSKESALFFKEIKSYFDDVNKKGFEFLWSFPPKKGKLFLRDEFVSEITLDQINSINTRRIEK